MKIYYAITPKFCNYTRYVNEGDYDSVYSRIMTITDGDHDTSASASSWCELACIGEVYEDDRFTIEIIEDVE